MLATRLVRLAAFTAIGLFGLTAAALAAVDQATTNTAANLRSGPGISYAVITSLPEGTDVDVNACTATWCAVETDYGNGFVARSLLDFDSFSDNEDDGDNGNIIITPGPGPSPEPDNGVTDVCFYQQANFMGANFCVTPGQKDANIPGNFDDNIESILVEGGASVEVCTDPGYGGECKFYSHSVKKLPGYLRNDITSYEVSMGGDDNSDDNSDDDNSDDGDFNLSM